MTNRRTTCALCGQPAAIYATRRCHRCRELEVMILWNLDLAASIVFRAKLRRAGKWVMDPKNNKTMVAWALTFLLACVALSLLGVFAS